ncbi:hypothetical protein BK009_03415 [Methanobacterium subterraneum]|uniref:DUF1819 family protein n=1 Tax=Methanobacterium subterraneum TaxID=59277 RepID=A0A2H4VTI6_9EURY|nr:DUF1819 family protein [Methanobacterium subterraneum]AUB61429.1 hypothetical protein BK009_03415 [Methanobacterium subterraneum]
MKYSAGLISKSYWYLESKKTAKYMLDGLSRKQIVELAISDNIYQVESEYRSKTIANSIYTRLISLPEDILEAIVNSDITTSKILVLISIMKTDRLFFEFMHEVFRNKVITGDLTIEERDLNIFFDGKKIQSEIIDKWVYTTIRSLKSGYLKMITESGLYNYESKEIKLPIFDYKVQQLLLENDLAPYLYAITGEK